MPKHHLILGAAGAIALGLAGAQTPGHAAPAAKAPLMTVAQAEQLPAGTQATPDELEQLTNEVVRSLKGLEDKENTAERGDLMDSLSSLVEKAMKEGKSSADVLQLIDEALKKQDGTTLQDLMARSGGKLDLQSMLETAIAIRRAISAEQNTQKRLTISEKGGKG